MVAPVGDRPAQILLVDDEPLILRAFERLLARDGYQLVIACTCREAREAVARQPFDVVVSDLHLPDGDGPALLQLALPHQPDLPRRFILMSGDLGAPATRDFLATTGCRALAKPFSVPELRAAVLATLEHEGLTARPGTARIAS